MASQPAASKLGNSARSEIVDGILAKKNAQLAKYVESGVLPGVYCPASMTQYRLWSDDSLGIERLGSPNSINVKDSPPGRITLIEEAASLVLKLRCRKKSPPPKRKPHAALHARDQTEIARLNKLVRGMTSTIHHLTDEVETTQAGYDQVVKDFTNLQREMNELRRAVGKRVGMRIVRDEEK